MKEIKIQKKYPIFRNVEENDILALFRCFSAKIIKPEKNRRIIFAGEKIEDIFIIISGRCRELVLDSDANVNTHIDYVEGNIIGLDYYINNRKTFKSDIYTVEDSEIILLNAFRLLNPCENYCPRHTRVLQNLFIELAKQHEDLLVRIKELTYSSTRKKVLSYLYNLKLKKRNNEFDLPYNRQELADHLGVERTALSKELSDLQKDGLIEFHKNHFKLLA